MPSGGKGSLEDDLLECFFMELHDDLFNIRRS
jgi:hypothetical protein